MAASSAIDCSFSLLAISLLTLNNIPNEILVNQIDVPPILTNGKGWPVTGSNPTATPIFTIA